MDDIDIRENSSGLLRGELLPAERLRHMKEDLKSSEKPQKGERTYKMSFEEAICLCQPDK